MGLMGCCQGGFPVCRAWSAMQELEVAVRMVMMPPHPTLGCLWLPITTSSIPVRHQELCPSQLVWFLSISYSPRGGNAFFHHSKDWTISVHPSALCPIPQKGLLSPPHRPGGSREIPEGEAGYLTPLLPQLESIHPSALPRPCQLHVLARLQSVLELKYEVQ